MAFSKANLAESLAENGDFASVAAANRAIEAIISTVKTQVLAGNQVNIAGLCNFKVATQAAKSGLIPGTNRTYSSTAKRVVRITPVDGFKNAMAVA